MTSKLSRFMEQTTQIRSLCKLYLGSPWNQLESERITVKPLGKGCSNTILIASARNDNGKILDTVLVRIYGENISLPLKLTHDVFLTSYLGYHLETIPKVRGLFEGGRFEQYVSSKNIERDEFKRRYKEIIESMASVHNLPDMPLPKDVFLAKEIRTKAPKLSESDKITWVPEVEWYLETLAVVGKDMRLSLCHNDVNQNNILIPDEYPEQLLLIDYEYTGYNYTMFDIANYCVELQYDWSHPVNPFFLFDDCWRPDDDAILDMIRHYKTLIKPEILTSDVIMLKQIKFLMIGSELMWALWAMSLDEGFNLDMDHYLAVKSDSYFKKKALFKNDIEDLLAMNTNGHSV